jgi:hypothetical protein
MGSSRLEDDGKRESHRRDIDVSPAAHDHFSRYRNTQLAGKLGRLQLIKEHFKGLGMGDGHFCDRIELGAVPVESRGPYIAERYDEIVGLADHERTEGIQPILANLAVIRNPVRGSEIPGAERNHIKRVGRDIYTHAAPAK